VLLISGSAGIGKSRSIEELEKLADSLGFKVLRGRCIESDGAPAFWPWLQLLRAAVTSTPQGSLLQALAEGAPSLIRLIPELRSLTPDLSTSSPEDARASRFVTFDSVTRFLRDLSSQMPLVLTIDDLHRADAASASLFEHVACELSAQPARLLLVATYRDGDLRIASKVADSVASVTTLAHTRTEALHGLDTQSIAKLVQLLSGRVPSEAVVKDLREKTNGNPFFITQILRVLENEDRLNELEISEGIDLELPPHIQDAICRQLRALPEPVRTVIECASVVGGDFTVADLETSAQLDRAAVLAHLGVAAEASVIGERNGEPGRYRFVHALVRDAVYTGLPLGLRAAIHGRVAAALEARYTEHPSAESAALAHHYSHSSNHADIAKAVGFFEMAAQWATARGAFEDTCAYLDQALALLDDSKADALSNRCRLLLQLGDALANAGVRDRARETLQAAAKIARHRSLHEQLATAALRYAPDFLAIETGIYDPDLVDLLEEALASLGDSATALRARLLARLAIALQWNHEQEQRSKVLCAEAKVLAGHVDDVESKEYIRTVEALINFSLIAPEDLLRLVDGQQAVSPSLELLQRVLRVTALIIAGRITDADLEIAKFSELVARSRHPQARWYVDLLKSTRALMEGRYGDADASSAAYLALGEKYGDRNASQSYAAQSVMRAFDFGDLDLHEHRIRKLAEMFPRMMAWRAAHALILAELNRVDESRAALRAVVDCSALEHSRPNEWYGTATCLALTCGIVGDRAIASKLYAELLPYRHQFVVFGYCSYCLGSTHRLLGALATGMREWDVATSHFEAALSRNSAIGAWACNARVHYEYARMLITAGKRLESGIQATRTLDLTVRFGMTLLATKANALLKEARRSVQ
jgi:predicted ATPase